MRYLILLLLLYIFGIIDFVMKTCTLKIFFPIIILLTSCSPSVFEKGIVVHDKLKQHYKKPFGEEGETTISYVTYKGSKFTGEAIEFAEGRPYSIREYYKGIPTGNFKTFFNNGNIEIEIKKSPLEEITIYDSLGNMFMHRSETAEGHTVETIFYPNGLPKERYIDKDRDFFLEFSKWASNGNLMEYCRIDSVFFRLDSVTGGVLEKGLIDEFRNKQGNWAYFYDSGRLKSLISYSNNLADGYAVTFTSDGLMETEGFYHNGKKEQSWKIYYSTGNLKEELNYLRDSLKGEYKEYWENGKLKIKGSFESGEKTGEWSFFDASGKLIHKEISK
jgi:antitoxin component YwqK of YwqJK toxin-antitoxin module